MRKVKGIDARYAWEVRAIGRASQFTVIRHSGRDGQRVRIEAESLEDALREAEDLGVDGYGRRPMVYAVTVDRMSIHVDDRHLRMLEEKGDV